MDSGERLEEEEEADSEEEEEAGGERGTERGGGGGLLDRFLLRCSVEEEDRDSGERSRLGWIGGGGFLSLSEVRAHGHRRFMAVRGRREKKK
jgi:hypothetical protein